MDPDLPIDKTTTRTSCPPSVATRRSRTPLAPPTLSMSSIFGELIPKQLRSRVRLRCRLERDRVAVQRSVHVRLSGRRASSSRSSATTTTGRPTAETGQQLPYLDSVTFKFIPETESHHHGLPGRESTSSSLRRARRPSRPSRLSSRRRTRRGSLRSGLGAPELPVRSCSLRAEREQLQRAAECVSQLRRRSTSSSS